MIKDDGIVRENVLEIVRTFGKLAGDIPPDRDLYADLRVESVNAISILLGLEEKFAIAIDDHQFARARTVDNLVDLVQGFKEQLCKQSA